MAANMSWKMAYVACGTLNVPKQLSKFTLMKITCSNEPMTPPLSAPNVSEYPKKIHSVDSAATPTRTCAITLSVFFLRSRPACAGGKRWGGKVGKGVVGRDERWR